MVIGRGDRVSDVIARDDRLIEVFAAAAPAFTRLRNPAMRRVMARLVTVEQAARIAGLDPEDLVARLNDTPSASEPEPDIDMDRSPTTPVPTPTEGRPAPLLDLDPGFIVDLDVRPDLRAGKEPFSRIMAARRDLAEGAVLRLRAIFEPVPLYEVFHNLGFEHWTEQRSADDWVIWFYRSDARPNRQDPTPPRERTVLAPDLPDPEGVDGVVVLDVRGMEPPEPMLRTLKALESLPPDHTLVQLNVKEPRFLLPQLAERGFQYEVREQEPGLVRVFIRRTGEMAVEESRTEDRVERMLDVRVIPPREKHPAILETFKALEPGESFILVNDHDPKPLRYQFEVEHTGEFGWEYLEQGPIVWRVRISRVD